MCPILKRLSNKLQTFREATRIINEIVASTKGNFVRILEHLLSYAEYQFGKEITGISYREREDGERIDNWHVDVMILHNINRTLINLYIDKNSIDSRIRNEMIFSCLLKRSLSFLNPWLVKLDSDDDIRMDSLLNELFFLEANMASMAMNKRQFDVAEGLCERCLAYSKRYGLEGEKKITMNFNALNMYSSLRERQGNYSDAVICAEECYNFIVEAYDPVHFQVQEAAGTLIDILIKKGDLFDAERYAQVTYANLRDKKNGIDQESEVIATGAYNLAKVLLKQKGDIVKAEELARENLRIRILLYGRDHHRVAHSCDLLSIILITQNKLGAETRETLERSLAIYLRYEGPDGLNTAVGNFNLGEYYCRLASKMQTQIDLLLLGNSYLKECLRIYSKIHGPTHPETVSVRSQLAIISREISRIEEA
jgi:tetratricopeptide (TPR) repeat protein